MTRLEAIRDVVRFRYSFRTLVSLPIALLLPFFAAADLSIAGHGVVGWGLLDAVAKEGPGSG
ncbi:MAG: hypothetical protein HY039_01385 [Nitrospirae bacterium]|nr:hypothetical protein [Nitrospirota bacterium]